MCGIAGFLGGYKPDILKDFSSALVHRGLDGDGVWHDTKTGIGLAHRRLSIIDLSAAAAQPMEDDDGRYVTCYNGEIYNYKDIAKYLNSKNYSFNAHSDTATLAPLYDLEGPAMLERLHGMFVFAIWDRKEKSLFVARDHAGIKPLYYAITPKGLVFASEMKALAGLVNPSVDAAAMAEYLTFLWTPGERTMLEGVKKLRPGHYLMARTGKGGKVEVEVHRWYVPPQAPLAGAQPLYDTAKTPADLLQLLDTVVAEQCTSDVPVGAFLSGGVDSSAIVASMVATGNRPAQTYCIGFAGDGMAAEGFEDDMAFAENVAKHLDVPFTPLVVEMEPLLKRLPTLPHVLDEPTADPAPLFVQDIAAQAKADGIKVLLSGTGGDDVFSGYRRHLTARLRQRMGVLCKMAGWGAGVAAPWTHGALKRRLQRLSDLLEGDDVRFLLHAFMTNSQPDAVNLLNRELREAAGNGWHNALTEARHETIGQDLLNRLLYMELFGFLPDHNLNYNDKAAMLAGVEGRVPLTDKRLLDFMADVPPENKLHQTALKWFLKEAVRPRLPQDVITRKKAGFGAPIRKWFKSGAGKVLIEEALFDSGLAHDWYDRRAVESFWKRTLNGEVDGTYTALALANMVWWGEGVLKRY